MSQALPDPAGHMTGPVFRAALIVGLLLTAAGALAQAMAVLGVTTAQLVLCSGLGIVFGAFGSTATIKYKGAVIAGVAAISIALLLIVDHLVRKDFVYLRIDGDIEGAQMELIGSETYHGAFLRKNLYEFIVTGRGISQDRLTLTLNFPPSEQGGKSREVPFECVPKSEIEPYLGSQQRLQWRFDDARGVLIGGAGNKVIAEVGPCRDARPATARVHTPTLFSSAFAATTPRFEDLLDALKSPSSAARREARDGLARAGFDAVRPMLDRLATAPESYQTRLGIVVALAEMLRDRKQQRQDISALLSDQDLQRLIEAAKDSDRTVRIYASEFLFDLGDPRLPRKALEAIESASDDGKYNLIIVIQGAFPDLSDEQRSNVRQDLEKLRPGVGPRTQALIDRVLRL
jgi:hypothetical protein